jgi:hypothetical protein
MTAFYNKKSPFNLQQEVNDRIFLILAAYLYPEGNNSIAATA